MSRPGPPRTRGLVVRSVPRPDPDIAEALGRCGMDLLRVGSGHCEGVRRRRQLPSGLRPAAARAGIRGDRRRRQAQRRWLDDLGLSAPGRTIPITSDDERSDRVEYLTRGEFRPPESPRMHEHSDRLVCPRLDARLRAQGR